MSVFKTHLKVTEDNKIRLILNIYLRTVVRGLVGVPAPPHTIKEDLYREGKITPKWCCFTWQTESVVVKAGEICTGNTSSVGREINTSEKVVPKMGEGAAWGRERRGGGAAWGRRQH